MSNKVASKHTKENVMRRINGHEDGCGLTELCGVFAEDDPHPVNGANYCYFFTRESDDGNTPPVTVGSINFQRGPRYAPDSILGTLDGAVLSVVIDRYEGFQRGTFSCPENDEVLQHLLAARNMIIQRAQERAARGVLGKNEK